eukprot:TRINITY_DN34266_c0_g1_i2.p1 TRINITY_DN34266_c0_g1~~TRINITY_DN34266_c0_g1_i2.p1  ORF type:complete len:305 (+),score=95.90 TRINITY_DN34266_c0_g1_i2:289-1203(+)
MCDVDFETSEIGSRAPVGGCDEALFEQDDGVLDAEDEACQGAEAEAAPGATMLSKLGGLPDNVFAQVMAMANMGAAAPVPQEKARTASEHFTSDVAAADGVIGQAQLEQLKEQGWALLKGVLEDQVLRELRGQAEELVQGNKLKEAGMSKQASHWKDSSTRGDMTMWLHEDEHDWAKPLFGAARRVRRELGGMMDMARPARAPEVQLAYYPPNGSHYVRHRDAFPERMAEAKSTRKMTMIVYTSEAWQPEHGGQLRLFEERPGGEQQHEVAPEAGTVLIFLSDLIEHEVLPNFSERFAYTMWFH